MIEGRIHHIDFITLFSELPVHSSNKGQEIEFTILTQVLITNWWHSSGSSVYSNEGKVSFFHFAKINHIIWCIVCDFFPQEDGIDIRSLTGY